MAALGTGPALSLSCLPPDPARTLQRAQDPSDI